MATVTRRRALAALAPLLGAGAASRLLSSDAGAQVLDRAVAGGIAGGMVVMYATGLLVSA
jgi:hypothetical protein